MKGTKDRTPKTPLAVSIGRTNTVARSVTHWLGRSITEQIIVLTSAMLINYPFHSRTVQDAALQRRLYHTQLTSRSTHEVFCDRATRKNMLPHKFDNHDHLLSFRLMSAQYCPFGQRALTRCLYTSTGRGGTETVYLCFIRTQVYVGGFERYLARTGTHFRWGKCVSLCCTVDNETPTHQSRTTSSSTKRPFWRLRHELRSPPSA